MRHSHDAPVVALDLDGTLGDWHTHFLVFAEAWLGKEISPFYRGGPLYRHMGVSRTTYRQIKLAFRQGGLKRSMPVYEGARELTVELRKAGAEVWICTTRPYLQLDNIDRDTRHWLRRNGVQHDGIIYGEHKYRDLVKRVDRARVVAVLDDLPELVSQASACRLPGMVRSQPWNWFSSQVHVEDLARAQHIFVRAVEEYRAERRRSA